MNLNARPQPKQVGKLTVKQQLTPYLIQAFKTLKLSLPNLIDDLQTLSQDNVFITLTQPEGPSITKGEDADTYIPEQKDSKSRSLVDHIQTQLDVLTPSKQEKAIFLALLDGLDTRGYFDNFKQTKAHIQNNFDLNEATFNKYLTQFQALDPPGIGAQNLKDCLLLQVHHMHLENDTLRDLITTVINHHLDDLNETGYEKIATHLNLEPEGIEAIHDFIKENLTPNPAEHFSGEINTQTITPSLEIMVENGQPTLRVLEEEQGPKISLSPHYLALLEDKNTDAETKAFLQTQFEQAKDLKFALEKRMQTLRRVGELLLSRQAAFFEHGHAFLQAFPQKELANELGLHPSTVSKLLGSKFIKTPHGTLPLSNLFVKSRFGNTKETYIHAIKKVIQDNPGISDEGIRKVLEKIGIRLARRTVNKYRRMKD